MSETETVEVTIKIPKKLMNVLEQENHFGWVKNDFYVASVIRSVSCEVNAMHYDKMKSLEAKYGKDLGTVSFEEVDGLKILQKIAAS